MKVSIYNQNYRIEADLETLTARELAALLKVRTTHDQAGQIRERNQQALDFIMTPDEMQKRIDIGCPHCNMMQCMGGSHCSWDNYPAEMRDGSRFSPVCASAVFGGYSLDYMLLVSFGPENVHVDCPDGRTQEQEKAITFLQGHVEWAKIVQKLPETATDWLVESNPEERI